MRQFLNWLDTYAGGIQVFLYNHIVLAPLFFLLIEEMGVPLPVPGDAIIAYVGYGLSKSDSAALWQAFILALASVLVGATVLFFLARRWGQTIIRRLGRFMFLKQAHIDRAEVAFQRYGVWAIIFGRHIPGLRIPITIFAASSGVRYPTFIASTFISTVGWVVFYLEVGSHFGGDFADLLRRDTGLTLAVFAVLALAVLGLHFYGLRQDNKSDKT